MLLKFPSFLVLQVEEGEEAFILEDTMNTDNMDAHSYDTSSLASSDSGDPAHPKRYRRVDGLEFYRQDYGRFRGFQIIKTSDSGVWIVVWEGLITHGENKCRF